MSPEQARELNNQLLDLNDVVIQANKAFLDILGPTAKKFKYHFAKQTSDTALDIENSTSELEDTIDEKEKIKRAQQAIFKKQLQRRGYDIEKNKVEISEIYELTDSQQKFLKELDKKQAKDKELIEALVAPGTRFANLAKGVNSFDRVLQELQDRMFEATGKSTTAAIGLQLGISALTGITKAMMVMTDAIFQGERGASVGAKGFKEFSDAVTSTIIGIGAALVILPFGKALKVVGAGIAALGAAAKGATKLIEMGAEINDKLFKSYVELSERGLTTSQGLTGLYDTLRQVGMSSAEIDKFNKLLSDNSVNLARFGGLPSEGIKRFSTVANAITAPSSKLNKEFLALGINSDAQREHIMKFMTEEDRLGLLQNLSDEQRITGAKKYIENLDKLSQLTGASRKEIEEARAEIIANENFRAALYQAEQDKSEAGQARLKELKSFQEAATLLRLTGDQKGAQGLIEYAAGRGITGQASATAFIQFGGRGGLIEAAKKGASAGDLAQAAAKGYDRQMEIMEDTARFGGDVSGLLTSGYTQGVDFLKRTTALIEEMQKKGYGSLSDYQDAEQNLRKNTKDKTTQLNAEIAQQQQKTAMMVDSAAYTIFKTTDVVLGPATKMLEKATELFEKSVGVKRKKETEKAPAGTAQEAREQRQQSQQNLEKATEERKKLEEEKGRASEEAKQARIREMQAREEARKKALEEASRRPATRSISQEPKALKMSASEFQKLDKDTTQVPTPSTSAATAATMGTAPEDKIVDLDKIFAFGNKSGSRSAFESLNSDFKDRVISAAKDYNQQTGKKIVINSATRNREDQERLYAETVAAGRPGIGPTGMKVGKPGNSSHEKGLAVDIQNYKDAIAVAAFNKKGLFQTVAKDPVHFTFSKVQAAQTGAMFEGPKEGYFVQLHGKEFVGNEKQLESIKKLISSVLLENEIKESPEPVVDYETDNSESILEKFTSMLENKTEELLDKIKFGNKVDTNLLNYSQG